MTILLYFMSAAHIMHILMIIQCYQQVDLIRTTEQQPGKHTTNTSHIYNSILVNVETYRFSQKYQLYLNMSGTEIILPSPDYIEKQAKLVVYIASVALQKVKNNTVNLFFMRNINCQHKANSIH